MLAEMGARSNCVAFSAVKVRIRSIAPDPNQRQGLPMSAVAWNATPSLVSRSNYRRPPATHLPLL